jgi:hypothetical protein
MGLIGWLFCWMMMPVAETWLVGYHAGAGRGNLCAEIFNLCGIHVNHNGAKSCSRRRRYVTGEMAVLSVWWAMSPRRARSHMPYGVWPCYEPGVRPMARHMGRLPVPWRLWATAIFTVTCRPMARQHEYFNKITYKLTKYKANNKNPNFMKLTIIKRSCVQCCLIKNLSR